MRCPGASAIAWLFGCVAAPSSKLWTSFLSCPCQRLLWLLAVPDISTALWQGRTCFACHTAKAAWDAASNWRLGPAPKEFSCSPWSVGNIWSQGSHVLCSSARVLGHCGLLNNYLLAGPVWAKIKSLYVVMVDKPFSLRDIKLVLLNLCKINECSGTYTFIKK